MSKKSIKKRNWAFVLYPESAPDNWIDILSEKGLSGAVSPLHDMDTNATGEIKKAHRHVILCFPGPTTYNCVKAICDELAQPIPQSLESVKGYYRYLTHKDNPEKAQYDEKDIITFGGFDYRDYVELSKTETEKYIRVIQELIREADVLEYSDLLDLLLDSDMKDEYSVAISHTVLFGKYIDSRRNKLGKDVKKVEITDGVPL